MSLLIKAKITKKHWLKWAREHLESKPQVEVADPGFVLQKLKESRTIHPPALNYEVPDVTVDDAITALTSSLTRLGISLDLCLVGDYLEPAVLRLTGGDPQTILREHARINHLVEFAPAAVDGRLVVEMPFAVPPLPVLDFMITCQGSLEKLIPEIQQAFPSGVVFPTRYAKWDKAQQFRLNRHGQLRYAGGGTVVEYS